MSLPTRECPKCECEMIEAEFQSSIAPDDSEPGWACPECDFTQTLAEYKDSREDD